MALSFKEIRKIQIELRQNTTENERQESSV